MVLCIVEKEKYREHHQKKYVDTNEKVVQTLIKKLAGNVTEPVKYWSSEDDPAGEDKFCSKETGEAVTGILRRVTSL